MNLTLLHGITCHEGSNLTLHRYHSHNSVYYTTSVRKMQEEFFVFSKYFSKDRYFQYSANFSCHSSGSFRPESFCSFAVFLSPSNPEVR